jgi:enoyl-CoA hydratase/carnithine racemase
MTHESATSGSSAGTTYDLPPELVVTAAGAVRTVTINRPEQLNAVNPALHWALANVWRQLSADREARVVILTGAGRTFCAGGDLDWLSRFPTDPVARYESLREGAEIIEEMIRFPLPVIAALNGAAVGLGCNIAVLCDVVLMSEKAHLADPHISVGLVAGDGGAAFWPLLTNIMRSREFLLTGERISASKAVELGLATRTTTPDALMDEAMTLAQKLADLPPLAVQGTKRILNMHVASALTSAMPMGFVLEEGTMQTEEHQNILEQLKPKGPG